MYVKMALAPVDNVNFFFTDVVRNIVNDVQFRIGVEICERATGQVRQYLAVCQRAVGAGSHCAQVSLTDF